MAREQVRIGALQVAIFIAVAGLLARAAQLQLIEGDEHRRAAEALRTERVSLEARRGGIYDRNGVPLALTREIYRVGIAPDQLATSGDLQSDIDRISRVLRVPEREIHSALESDKYLYFRGPFSAAQLREIDDIYGIHPEEEYSRYYPDPDLARSIIGHPNRGPEREATYLESEFDSLLTGLPGSAVVLRDGRGRRYQSPSRLDAFPEPGSNVFLTIDADLQDIVELALTNALAAYDARGGDALVLDPRTGEILAAASYDSLGRPVPGIFRSVYEPGSTAKLFAAAALLEYDLINEEDRVWGEEGRWETDLRVIEDVHEVGWATLDEVIEYSSNIGIAKFIERATPEQQFDMLRRFGFGIPTGVEFPGEAFYSIRHPRQWSPLSNVSLAMGYELAVTPVQLAAAYGAIANEGILLRPTIVSEVHASDGTVIYKHEPEPVRRAVSPETANELLGMLSGVVYSRDGLSAAALSSYEVAGKTGTSRRAEDGAYIPGAYNASFAAIFPADDPQLITVVRLVDPTGTFGSQTAAPVTRSVLEQVLASRSRTLDARNISRVAARVPSEVPPDAPVKLVPFPLPDPVVRESTSVVPDVGGLALRRAVAELHSRGLRARAEGVGTVISTTPAAGESVMRGEVVSLELESQ